MATFTFIRHGETRDNIQAVWAGWKDSPLSNHGMNQAKAVAEHFSATQFTAILSSDLKRAYTTAETIHARQKDPRPPFSASELLREQHFGTAEGKSYKRISLPLDPDAKFPGGESKSDLRRRAARVVDELLLPYVLSDDKEEEVTIAVVSHGLLINEMIAALFARGVSEQTDGEMRRKGLRNTAWASMSVTPTSDGTTQRVRLTEFNCHPHLDKVVRQKGGIGSISHDSKQKDIRAFFAKG